MFQEFLFVLAHSKRTQLALVLAVIFPLGVLLLGEYMVGRIAFSGPLAPMTEVVRETLSHRYDKAALVCLLGFLGLAVKSYLRARKRLLQL